MKKDVALELFPAEKTCAQGCPPCPLAKRGNSATSAVINPDVQESFWVFEKFVKKFGLKYKLFYNGPWRERNFDLFPKMRYHWLVNQLAGTDLSKISSESNVDEVIEDVFDAIQWYTGTFFTQKLDAYRMTMVPQNLFVGEFERDLASGIAKKVFDGDILVERGGKFQFEVRSNLVPKKNLERDLSQIELNNEIYLGQTVLDFWRKNGSKGIRKKSSHHHPNNGELAMIYAEYGAVASEEKFFALTNRVIANSQTKIDKQFLIDQASPNVDRENIHFAIAAQGVMFHHSSVAINNPILWISHETFQRELKYMGSIASKNQADLIEALLLIENLRIFKGLEFERLPVSEWIKRFDEVRNAPGYKRAWER